MLCLRVVDPVWGILRLLKLTSNVRIGVEGGERYSLSLLSQLCQLAVGRAPNGVDFVPVIVVQLVTIKVVAACGSLIRLGCS